MAIPVNAVQYNVLNKIDHEENEWLFHNKSLKKYKIDYLMLRHPFRSLLNLSRIISTTSLSISVIFEWNL